jgi:hypothetical protein
MKAVAALLLLQVICFASADISVSFKGNITLSNANEFTYRKTSVKDVSIPRLYSAMFMSSISVNVNANSATSDGLFGTAYAGFGIPPSGYLAFYDSASSWSITSDFVDANVSSSRGFVGSVYASIQEVTPQGNISQTLQLKSMTWSMESSNTGNGSLRYASFLGTSSSQPNLSVRVTYVVSDVVGVLNVAGQAVVTPKSLESIIQISNYSYADSQNFLRLNIGVGTAASTVSAQGSLVRLVSGDGQNSAYFTVDGTAQVNGQPTQVSIVTQATSKAGFGNDNLAGQVNSKYEGSADFKIVTVSFPPGATEIILDPSIGAGSPPPQIQSGDSSATSTEQGGVSGLVPSLFLVLLVVVKLSL